MTTKHIVLIHTGAGVRYAERVHSSIRWIAEHTGVSIHAHTIPADSGSIERTHKFQLHNIQSDDILIHSRAAHPTAPWMSTLRELERSGIQVVNPTECLTTTSDKWDSLQVFFEHLLPIPETIVYTKGTQLDDHQKEMIHAWSNVVAKPRVSRGNGKHIYCNPSHVVLERDLETFYTAIPDREIILQERLRIESIFRVILIGGKPLSWITQDKPEWHTGDDWKVSVCLNKLQRIAEIRDERIIELAKAAQRAVGGEVNFVDIFSVWGKNDPRFGPYVISEINTACNLRIHELLAREAGKKDWNVHYQIAKYLVGQF